MTTPEKRGAAVHQTATPLSYRSLRVPRVLNSASFQTEYTMCAADFSTRPLYLAVSYLQAF